MHFLRSKTLHTSIRFPEIFAGSSNRCLFKTAHFRELTNWQDGSPEVATVVERVVVRARGRGAAKIGSGEWARGRGVAEFFPIDTTPATTTYRLARNAGCSN